MGLKDSSSSRSCAFSNESAASRSRAVYRFVLNREAAPHSPGSRSPSPVETAEHCTEEWAVRGRATLGFSDATCSALAGSIRTAWFEGAALFPASEDI